MRFDQLARWIPAVEREMAAAFRRLEPLDDEIAPLVAALEAFSLRGGKRLRALLVLAGFWLASGQNPRPALPAAAAMEQFQSWMLVHDDLIDHAETRRGGPALHRALAAWHRSRRRPGDATAFGEGTALTLGDLEEPMTVEGLLRCRVAVERRVAALEEYVRMTRATALGQLLDIELSERPLRAVEEAAVLRVHALKTAAYTTAGPLRIGASLGGGGARLLRDLGGIATDLGIAFQLRDDVLGAGLGPTATEKSANDLVEGKRTLLVVAASKLGTPRDRRRLTAVLGRRSASPGSLRRAREAIQSTGSLARSEAEIARLTARAGRRIDRSHTLSPAGRDLLRSVGDRLVRRTR